MPARGTSDCIAGVRLKNAGVLGGGYANSTREDRKEPAATSRQVRAAGCEIDAHDFWYFLRLKSDDMLHAQGNAASQLRLRFLRLLGAVLWYAFLRDSRYYLGASHRRMRRRSKADCKNRNA